MSEYLNFDEPDPLGIVSLEIHVDYDYLRPRDLADVCTAIEDAYRICTRILISNRFEYYAPGEVVFYAPRLALTEVCTGNSIDLVVEFANQTLPHISIAANKAHVVLPSWACVLMVVGYCFQWGTDLVKNILEILKLLNHDHDQTTTLSPELKADLTAILAEIQAIKAKRNIRQISVKGKKNKP